MAWSSVDGSKRVSRTWNCRSWERDERLDGKGRAEDMLAAWTALASAFLVNPEIFGL